MKRRKKKSCGLSAFQQLKGVSVDEALELKVGQILYNTCGRRKNFMPVSVEVIDPPAMTDFDGRRDVELHVRGTQKGQTFYLYSLPLRRMTTDPAEAFCCRGNPTAGIIRGALSLESNTALRTEMKFLLKLHKKSKRAAGKTCLEKRMVAIDEILQKRGVQ